MSRVLILNAPPGVGKDTLAGCMEDNYGMYPLSFKAPLFDMVYAILGEPKYLEFLELYDDREHKEIRQAMLGMKSPREFMIDISERMIKPCMGNDYFGQRALAAVNAAACTVVFSDGGFADEVKPLVDAGHEVHIVQLQREGYTFAGDSRTYITIEGAYHHRVPVIDGDVAGTAKIILESIEEMC